MSTIFWFEVPVNDELVVEVAQSGHNLRGEELRRLNQLRQVALITDH